MKKTRILAVALSASLIALPLAACGEGTEFNPADYAATLQSEEFKEVVKTKALYTKATKVDGQLSLLNSYSNFPVAKLAVDGGKYKLYDLAEEKVLTGTAFDDITYSDQAHLIALSVSDGTDQKIGLCTVTGEDFLSVGTYEDIDFNYVTAYLNGSYEETVVYSVTYTTENASKETTKYYTFDYDTNKTTVISSDEFRTTQMDTSAGTTAKTLPLETIYDNDKENPLSEYAYSYEIGNYTRNYITERTYAATVTLYKSGAEVGKLSLDNAFIVGAVGNYMYYYEVTVLPESAESGYNVLYQQNNSGVISSTKYNFTLYRYDIVKGGDPKEIKADYLYVSDAMRPLYNNTAKAYDKAYVDVFKFEKGVAFISDDEVMTYQLIVDDTLAVSYDMTSKPYYVHNLIQLKENRYLASGTSAHNYYILDEKLNAIANFSSLTNIDAQQQLILCELNDKAMAVDFDGKIVFEPKYSALNFYGDYALADVTEKSGKENDNMIVSKTNPNGKAMDAIFSDAETEGVTYSPSAYGYILKTKITGSDSDLTTTYSLYNYAGTEICTLDGAQVGLPVSFEGKALVTVFGDTGYATYIVS